MSVVGEDSGEVSYGALAGGYGECGVCGYWAEFAGVEPAVDVGGDGVACSCVVGCIGCAVACGGGVVC